MQTREDRIYRHYRSLKKSYDYRSGEGQSVWMKLARHWRIPIRDLMEIIAEEKRRRAAQ